jgi:hypothetical protein
MPWNASAESADKIKAEEREDSAIPPLLPGETAATGKPVMRCGVAVVSPMWLT